MIRKLRQKFIAVSMVCVLLVLIIVMGTINILNYRQIIQDADFTLGILTSNDGAFPRGDKPFKSEMMPPPKKLSPELPFETRFFSVVLNDRGAAISIDTGKIAAIDTETAAEYGENIWQNTKQTGFMEHYRYTKQNTAMGTRIIFLDCSKVLSTFYSFLLTSIFVSIFCFLFVFILITLLSGKIIKPVLESYEKQKRFITDAGHEIKTPLTIIDADTSILEMEQGENEWIRDIQVQTKRLTDLTNDLIYLSRMEEEQHKLQMIDFPISDVILETAQSFQSLAQVQHKCFYIDVEREMNFFGDEKAVRQLISILLDNALKYSPTDGSISLTAKKKGKAVLIQVFNTTDSICKENLDHLFDRFYRADASRNSQTGGYGIGLSIAKAVVLAHKGKINALSQDGKSILITIHL